MLDIPINSKVIDDKTFKMEFIGKSKVLDWEEVKELFFSSGSSRSVLNYFGNQTLLKLCEKFSVSKEKLFEILRRLKMLNELENKDGS